MKKKVIFSIIISCIISIVIVWFLNGINSYHPNWTLHINTQEKQESSIKHIKQEHLIGIFGFDTINTETLYTETEIQTCLPGNDNNYTIIEDIPIPMVSTTYEINYITLSVEFLILFIIIFLIELIIVRRKRHENNM